MNCKKCNTQIADDALYCSACGDRTAVHAQEEKIHAVKKRTMGILKEQLRTPLFLVLAICISIIAAFQVISLFSDLADMSSEGFGFIVLLVNILFSVLYILSAIGAWKLYASKDESVNAKDVGWFVLYSRTQRVIAILINIGAGIIAALLVLVGFVGNSIMSSVGDFSSDISSAAGSVEGGESVADTFDGIAQFAGTSGMVMVIVSILVATIIMVAAISHGRAWRKMVRLLSTMKDVSMGNNYPRFEKSPSYSVLYVWGVLFGLSSLALLCLGAGLLDTLPGIATGVFMFAFALFFQAFHDKEEANRVLLAKEAAMLDTINAEIDSELRRAERERHEAEEAKMRQAQMAQQQSQEKMQQMMMAMMMNNMSQNKNSDMQEMMKAMTEQLQNNSEKTEQ